jgi:hypothetical protein
MTDLDSPTTLQNMAADIRELRQEVRELRKELAESRHPNWIVICGFGTLILTLGGGLWSQIVPREVIIDKLMGEHETIMAVQAETDKKLVDQKAVIVEWTTRANAELLDFDKRLAKK